jgi:hypothetical protein
VTAYGGQATVVPNHPARKVNNESQASSEPWPSRNPAVVAGHVCRRWRDLSLGTPLLWTKIEILLPWASLEEQFRNSGFQETLRRDNIEAYLLQCISRFRPYIDLQERRVRSFIQRSSGCPLNLLIRAQDIPGVPSSSRVLDEWRTSLKPLYKLLCTSTARWQSLNLDVTVCSRSARYPCAPYRYRTCRRAWGCKAPR